LSDDQILYLATSNERTLDAVDQTAAPDGPTLGSRPWQSLGRVTTNSGTVTLHVQNAGAGNLAADAIRLERAVLPDLTFVDARGNWLDVRAHEAIIPGLEDKGVNVISNTDVLDDLLAGDLFNAAGPGQTEKYDVSSTASRLMVRSDNEHLSVAPDGATAVTVSADAQFRGPANILLTAYDSAGNVQTEIMRVASGLDDGSPPAAEPVPTWVVDIPDDESDGDFGTGDLSLR
jgi:hypothetical protein